MEPIEAALAAVEMFEPGEIPTHTRVAQDYGVVRSTLTLYIQLPFSLPVENMWVQSRLVEGRLVVLAVRGGTALL
jgi:hypothetical protein